MPKVKLIPAWSRFLLQINLHSKGSSPIKLPFSNCHSKDLCFQIWISPQLGVMILLPIFICEPLNVAQQGDSEKNRVSYISVLIGTVDFSLAGVTINSRLKLFLLTISRKKVKDNCDVNQAKNNIND